MVNLFSIEGKVVRTLHLPKAFKYPIRRDLIVRFTNAYRSNGRTPYGSYPYAGMRRVGHNMGPNHGISRYPRVAGTSRGVLLGNARGGKSPFHPVAEKDWHMKVNRKERAQAKLSALSSTAEPELVKKRGHIFETESLPVVLEDEFENISRTKDAIAVLKNIGVFSDILRSKQGTKIRAGRGKSRGRKYVTPKSILFVLEEKGPVSKALKNLPGVDVVKPEELNAYLLAPGGNPGRLVVMTEGALNQVRKWKL